MIYDEKFTSFEMFFVADYIITDYSAVIFEAMLLNKPLFLYSYDYDSYHMNRDFYVDYQEYFKGIVYQNAEIIIKRIEEQEYDVQLLQQLVDKMICRKSTSYTQDICDFIMDKCKK